jgi:hypothetical protein
VHHQHKHHHHHHHPGSKHWNKTKNGTNDTEHMHHHKHHKKSKKNPMIEGKIHKVFKEDLILNKNATSNTTVAKKLKAPKLLELKNGQVCCPLPGNPLVDTMYKQ